MNVLILTPDAVGSTLLQRLITIYLTFHELDRPVINLHELTNGLEKYYSPEFGREIVSKRRVANWRYYQTLEQIVEILSSVDHFKTSRLAHYHIRNRQDTIAEQLPFYQYLDENFFIIACRRHNLFEHALSLSLNKITKRLNVYTHREKIDVFTDLYINKVSLDTSVFISQLDAYSDYLAWADNHFNIGSVFYYDKDVTDIEKYILNLPIFSSRNRSITWQEKFGIDFADWNRCHHIPSDIGTIALDQAPSLHRLRDQAAIGDLVQDYQTQAPAEWPAVHNMDDFQALPVELKTKFYNLRTWDISPYLPADTRAFYAKNQHRYQQANAAIARMQELDIVVSPPPIKKQSLAEKLYMITNWETCLDLYNEWIGSRPELGATVSLSDLQEQIKHEQQFWAVSKESTGLPNVAQLIYRNGAHPEPNPTVGIS